MKNQHLSDNAQLALDTILRKPTESIPSAGVCFMHNNVIERLAGAEPGAYKRGPQQVYSAAQKGIGLCMSDQHIPWHPLKFDGDSFTQGVRSTGIVHDGIVIDSPEAVNIEAFVEGLKYYREHGRG